MNIKYILNSRDQKLNKISLSDFKYPQMISSDYVNAAIYDKCFLGE